MLMLITIEVKKTMFNDKQIIKSGETSENYQAGGDITVNQGLSYSDVKDVAMSIFESNFYKLSDAAATIATKRAEEMVETLLDKINKLEKDYPNIVSKIENPDVQYAVVNAQKQYARSGNQNMLNVLSDLLANRFLSDEESLKSIVLNEAIEVITKLTINQINIITTIFIVKNVQMNSASKFIEVLSSIMPHQIIETGESLSLYDHLMYTGAASSDLTSRGYQNLEYLISESYSKDLDEQIDSSILNEIEPPVRKQFAIKQEYERTFENWNRSLMRGYSLTSVGKAIAIANINSSGNLELSLDTWIKD